jgi:starch synthase (maltosyl-transferring)
MTKEFGKHRAVVERVQPEVDGGLFPVKRSVNDRVTVKADIFTDGHDAVSAILLYKPEEAADWIEAPLTQGVNDRWEGEFTPTTLGRWVFTVEAWVDHFKTWLRDLHKRIAANQDTEIDYLIGADLVEAAEKRADQKVGDWLKAKADSLRKGGTAEDRRLSALDEDLKKYMALFADRSQVTRYCRELSVIVDPVRARFSSWYEFFPRSASLIPGQHGTFKDCEAWIPYVAKMGFDVLYLPPIHPIGVTFRKGANNAVEAQPGEVGSPWAIGGAEGGHKSIHPQLGTLADFHSLVKKAKGHAIDVAIDIAFQASPDHPYVKEHPDWFRQRPDGTIQYAENPPKKYQDIYPFDFESDSWESMWEELTSVFLYWVEQGVSIFRVDNPHTKAFPFWEWAIAKVKKQHPEVLFLSEAFTRPKVMYRLAKVGFTQSYTYFPWRHGKHEIIEYFTELTQTEVKEYFRPNHWPNTPDILTEYLQTTGRTGFMTRLLLAATLGANYGIYGPPFEQMVGTPRHQGSEEYLNSEKYQIQHWDLQREDSLADFIGLVNRIRKENPALQNDHSLRFHNVPNDQLLCFSKQSPDGDNLILVVVNLDLHNAQSGFVELPVEDLGLEDEAGYYVHELLSGARYPWRGSHNYVEIRPWQTPAQIFRIVRKTHNEEQFEYFL